jgi:hypothetical protein
MSYRMARPVAPLISLITSASWISFSDALLELGKFVANWFLKFPEQWVDDDNLVVNDGVANFVNFRLPRGPAQRVWFLLDLIVGRQRLVNQCPIDLFIRGNFSALTMSFQSRMNPNLHC